jgi:hypothetical protein
MKVIAISGFKSSGKDSAANYLVQNHGFQRVAFADPLKDMVSQLFGIDRSWLDDPTKKELPLKKYPAPATDGFTQMISNFMVREFRTLSGFQVDVKYTRVNNGTLQTFHNQWENLYHTPRSLAILLGSSMRAGASNFWVGQAINNIRANENRFYVISDLRYKSEMEQLKEAFGDDLVTIRINRFDSSPSNDPSERDLDEVKHDHTLENKGTKEEFFSLFNGLISNLK